MKHLLPILSSFAFLVFFSCTDNQEIQSDPQSDPVVDSTDTIEVVDSIIARPLFFNYEPDAELFMNGYHYALTNFTSAPLFFILDNDSIIFIASKSDYEFEKKYNYKEVNSNHFEMPVFMVDGNGKQLTKNSYDRIYNPDVIAYGYCEVKNNGKYGLVNTTTFEEISPKYNCLFPTENDSYIAIGKKKTKFYFINSDGSEELISEKSNYPNYQAILDSTKIETNTEDIHPIFLSTTKYDLDELKRNQFDMVFFTPSYVEVFETLPFAFLQDRNMEEGYYDEEELISMEEVQSIPTQNNSTTFFTSFTEEYIGGRGSINEVVEMSTFDKTSTQQSKKTITNDKRYGWEYSCEIFKITQVNDSLIEIHKNKDYDEKMDLDYAFSSEFEYYVIKKDGSIVKSEVAPISLINFEARHLTGCFAKFIPQEEQSEEGYGTEMWITEHLSIEDLQYMRNELFAKKGLIFKSEKWQTVFGEKEWYNPTYDNVDNQLSETEKKNVDFILSVEKKMNGKEKEYTKPHKTQYVAAG